MHHGPAARCGQCVPSCSEALHARVHPHARTPLPNALHPPPTSQKKKKYEPPAPPPRVGKKQKRRDAGATLGARMPAIAPTAKCRLRLLKLERVKDYLLMEEEFVRTQELLKPHEERNEEERTKARSQRGGACWSAGWLGWLPGWLGWLLRTAGGPANPLSCVHLRTFACVPVRCTRSRALLHTRTHRWTTSGAPR